MDQLHKWNVQARSESNQVRTVDFYNVLTLHVFFAIGIHDHLSEEINRLYSENLSEAVTAYRNSSFYNHPSFRSFLAIDEKKIIKVASIYAMYEVNGEGRTFLLKMINKGYKRIVDYVSRTSKLNMDHFTQYLKDRSDRYLPEMHLYIQVGVALYLTGQNGINPKDVISIEIIKELCGNVSNYINTENVFENKLSEHELAALQRFQSTTNVKFSRTENVDALISKIEEHHAKEASKRRSTLTEDVYKWTYKQAFIRYAKPLSSILRIHGLNDFNFYAKTTLTRDEYIDIYTLFTDSVEKERVKEEDFEVILVACILIFVLVKQYKELRNAYIEEDVESVFKIVEQLNQLKSKEEEREKEIQRQKAVNGDLEARLTQQEEYIKSLERRLKEQENSSKEDTLLRKEVIALREYVFQNEHEPEPNRSEESREKPNINHMKIAIVGGHQRWHAKIKNEYPSIRTITPDEKTIDYSFLTNMDIVCFETSYSNHVLYKKAMSVLDGTDVEIQYVNGSVNLDALAYQLSKVRIR